MRLIALTFLVCLLAGTFAFASGEPSNPGYTIGNELVPKILSKVQLPDGLSYPGAMAIDSSGYLWVTGTELVTGADKKREFLCKIMVYDISKPTPKMLVMHELKSQMVSRFDIYDHYLYMIKQVDRAKKPDGKKENQASRLCYLIVYDIADIYNPVEVYKTDPQFRYDPEICIDTSSKMMYAFDSNQSGLSNRGVLDQSKLLRFSLEDPSKPRQVSSKIITYSGKELSILDGHINDVKFRDNLMFAISDKNIYAFDKSGNDLKLVDMLDGNVSYFGASSLADEYMSKDQTYFFVTGNTMEFFYPGAQKNPEHPASQDGLMLLSFYTENVPPMGSFLGMSPGVVRLPFGTSYIYSKGPLVYAIGRETSYDRNVRMNSKLLVVDFTQINDPKFSGVVEFDGYATSSISRDNRIYTLVSSADPKDKKKFLETIELPVKEGVFRNRSMTLAEMYPGYKEPVIESCSAETVLRDILDKPSGELTSADFKGIKSLDLSGKKITDLKGLELCTDLEDLNLYVNYVEDASQLAGLTGLKKLNLSANKIKDLGFLTQLTSLEELNLQQNKFSDITPLSSLVNLSKLNLANNPISDPTPVSKLTNLTELKLGYCNILKPPKLSSLNKLESLNLMSNSIYSTEFIDDLSVSIKELNFWGNNIKSIDGLDRLVNLQKLNLHDNNLTDLSFLSNANSLTELDISSNKKITDLSPLSTLTNLKTLDIGELFVDDLSFIRPLINLENLDISHINFATKKFSNLKPLADLRKLTTFRAGQNEIKSIEPLSNLTELTSIDLEMNQVSDTKPLGKLVNLQNLNLSRNKIENVDSLGNLAKLADLNLSQNEIKDISLLSNSKISENCNLTLGANPIPDDQINEIRRKMIILPNEHESTALSNLISVANCEINYFKDKGKYTTDLTAFTSGGYLLTSRNQDTLTLDNLVSGYDVLLFDVKVKDFTIVITPKKDVHGRTFAMTSEGVVIEWLGSDKPDLAGLDLKSSNWKHWPKETKRFSVYACSTGG